MKRELLENYRCNRQKVQQLTKEIEEAYYQDLSASIDIVKGSSSEYPYISQRFTIHSKNEDKAKIIKEHICELEKKRKSLLQDMHEVEKFVQEIPKATIREIIELYFLEGDKRVQQEKVAEIVGYSRGRISQIVNEYLKD